MTCYFCLGNALDSHQWAFAKSEAGVHPVLLERLQLLLRRLSLSLVRPPPVHPQSPDRRPAERSDTLTRAHSQQLRQQVPHLCTIHLTHQRKDKVRVRNLVDNLKEAYEAANIAGGYLSFA